MRANLTASTAIGTALACLTFAASCGGGVDAGEGEGLEEASAPVPLSSEAGDGLRVPPPRPGGPEPGAAAVAQAPAEPAETQITPPAKPLATPGTLGTGPAAAGSAPSVGAPLAVALEAQADATLAGGDFAGAARQYSALLLAEIEGGGPADQVALDRFKQGLDEAQAGYRWARRADWPATTVRVRPGDSLIAIRKRVLAEHPEILLCTGLIARTNQLRSSTAIRADDELRVPLARPRAVVDLSARWVFYFLGEEVAAAWRVGVGKQGAETRVGRYTIKDKQENPPWHRAGHPMVAFGDPENPLGTRWMSWDDENGWHSSLGFHGTNDETGVGGAVSAGCIRMRNADVEQLFEILPVGSEVLVQP